MGTTDPSTTQPLINRRPPCKSRGTVPRWMNPSLLISRFTNAHDEHAFNVLTICDF